MGEGGDSRQRGSMGETTSASKGTQSRDIRRRRTAGVWKGGQRPCTPCYQVQTTRCLSGQTDRQTQLRDSSYPIHGDIGPVVDSAEGRRQGRGVAAVLRKSCPVQHKPKILVSERYKKDTSDFER